MTLFNDLFCAIPLGVIYNLFIYKLSDVLFGETETKEKTQKTLSLLFFAGITALILAQIIFTKSEKYKNKTIQHGLIIGGLILIIYSTFTNWDKMTNETKLIIMAIALVALI